MRTGRRVTGALWIALCGTMIFGTIAGADGPDMKKALGDKVADGWIYDDIEKGYAEAEKTGKPMLVVFR